LGIAKKSGINAPSLFNAIILAITRVLKAKVLTGDEHFKSLKHFGYNSPHFVPSINTGNRKMQVEG